MRNERGFKKEKKEKSQFNRANFMTRKILEYCKFFSVATRGSKLVVHWFNVNMIDDRAWEGECEFVLCVLLLSRFQHNFITCSSKQILQKSKEGKEVHFFSLLTLFVWGHIDSCSWQGGTCTNETCWFSFSNLCVHGMMFLILCHGRMKVD